MTNPLKYCWPCFVICLALLCFSSEAFSAASLQGLSRQAAKKEATHFFEQGKYQEAYDLYILLLREDPGDPEINLGLARSAVGAQRPNQAIMAYERLLEVYPTEATLYDELAQIYISLGDKPNALRAMEQKQAQAGTDPKVDAEKIRAWEGQSDRSQLHGAVRTGVLFDSNANQGPSSNKMMLGNWNIEFPNTKNISSFAGYTSALLDYSWRTGQKSAWWLVNDTQVYIRGNTNNELGYSQTRNWVWGRSGVGVRRLGSSSLFDMRVKGEVFDYELYTNIWGVGPEFLYAYALTPHVQLISRGGIDQRKYSRDKDRNGIYSNAGLYGRLLFGENSKHEMMAGGRYLGGVADNDDYSYDGWESSANVTFRLPKGFEVGPALSYAKEYYNGPATILETKKREEERIRMGLFLNYVINPSWKIETSYQHTKNNSTSSLYKYTQDVISMGVAWTF